MNGMSDVKTFTHKHLQQLFEVDDSKGKPKRVRKPNGDYTKSALKWNLKMLKQGKTKVHADTSKVFNPNTQRLVMRKHNKNKQVIGSVLVTNRKKKTNVRQEKQVATKLKQLESGAINTLTVDLSVVNLKKFFALYLEHVKTKRVAGKVFGTDQWIAFSNKNINDMLSKDLMAAQMSGSDQRFISKASTSSTVELEVIDHKSKDKLGGGFFKHYHTLDGVDLSRHDIYPEMPKDGCRDNCLYKCFESWGLKESKLALLKQTICQNYVANFKLKEIASLLNVYIKINKILLVKGKETTKTDYKGDKNDPMIHIATFDNHYFLVEKTDISKCAFENFNEVKHLDNWKNIVGKPRGDRQTHQRRNGRGISSLDLVRGLIKFNYIKDIPAHDLMNTQFWNQQVKTSVLDFDEDKCCRPMKPVKQKRKDFIRVFVSVNKDKTQCHLKAETGERGKFDGATAVAELVAFLPTVGSKLLMISHNSKHDYYALSKHMTECHPYEQHGTVKCAMGKAVNILGKVAQMQMMDSNNLFGIQLKDFPRMFQIKPNKNPASYLMKAYDQFRNRMLLATGLDVHDYNTLPTLANDFLKATECYEGCFEIAGVPRKFIQDCVVGGRVCMRDNERQMCSKNVSVLDANSHYAHAMSQHGFIKGTPKIIPEDKLDDREWLMKQDQFFVEAKGVSSSESTPFPVISVQKKKKNQMVREWTNDTHLQTFMMDKFTAEDVEKHQPFQCKVLRGCYFDEGTNDKNKEVISTLHQKRQEAKGTPMELIFKAILTAAHGCSMVKPMNTKTHFIPERKWRRYFSKNYNYIVSHQHIKGGTLFTVNQGFATHFNAVHIGCSVYSQSKQLMNEAMSMVQTAKCTDTDSIHLDTEEVATLAAKWKDKHGHNLIGNNLGQFKVEAQAKKALCVSKKSHFLSEDDRMRMKAVPTLAVVERANTDFNGDVWDLCEHLFRGDPVSFCRHAENQIEHVIHHPVC